MEFGNKTSRRGVKTVEPIEKCHSEALAEESQICNILSLLDSSPANGSTSFDFTQDKSLTIKGGVRVTEGTFHGFSTDSVVLTPWENDIPIQRLQLTIVQGAEDFMKSMSIDFPS